MNTLTKTTIKSAILLSVIAASLMLLISCGGDGVGGTGITPGVQGILVRSNEAKLSTYFQNSIKQSNGETTGIISPDTINASADASGGGADGFFSSSTNIQEAGVDEADLIKTNGRYIYSIKKRSNIFPINGSEDGGPASSAVAEDIVPGTPTTVSDIIRIMDTQGTDGLTEVKHLSSDQLTNEKAWDIAGLYLHEAKKHLVALTSSKHDYYANWFNSNYFSNQETKVLLIDVNTPEEANITSTLNFEGQLISSRRNGDTLYIILRHYPDYQYVDDNQLATTTTDDFLPRYQIGNGAKQLITQAKDCYVEADQKGSADVITLVAIDIASATPQINSQCYVGSAEALYASQKSLYLATTRWDYQANGGIASYNNQVTTDIHKFSYSGLNFDYRGSAEVQGHLGYNQDSKSFRFSESEDLLRVITVDEDQWSTIQLPVDDSAEVLDNATSNAAEDATPQQLASRSPVSLTILEEDSTKKALKIVSKIPNDTRPQPIGLPGERLYATRFVGNRAYVITFRITDPLYVLDLNNPSDPFIAGELKVDGYSDYLHPISENLLLGIGKDAIPTGSGDDSRGAWYQGVKLSLIDISDPSNPHEADKVILGKRGTETTVLYDHHAFTSLQIADKYRVAIPVQLHEGIPPILDGGDQASQYHQYKQTGLYRFEIDINNQKINQIPAMIISDENSISSEIGSIYNDRSVLINEDVYYLHDGALWSQDWQGTEAIIGPK